MPRRARITRRIVPGDPKFNNKTITKFSSKLMMKGKRSLAERIIYQAFDIIEAQQKRNPLDVFDQAIRNATPSLEVKPRRVGGATYQVPVDIKGDRRLALAMRWLIRESRRRNGKSMAEKLAAELTDASHNIGATIKKREDTHKMAESNKAFAHYRW